MDVMLLGLLNKTSAEVLEEAKRYANEIVTGGDIDISGQITEEVENYFDEQFSGTAFNSFKQLLQYVATHQEEYQQTLGTINQLLNTTQIHETEISTMSKEISSQGAQIKEKSSVIIRDWGADA